MIVKQPKAERDESHASKSAPSYMSQQSLRSLPETESHRESQSGESSAKGERETLVMPRRSQFGLEESEPVKYTHSSNAKAVEKNESYSQMSVPPISISLVQGEGTGASTDTTKLKTKVRRQDSKESNFDSEHGELTGKSMQRQFSKLSRRLQVTFFAFSICRS